MDNFEYSIQINDRDWEEFYSTAEECGLMQVSLAAEEELLLSDTEREDATCSTASSNPKFIRVSLCPPVGNHREPQPMQVALSPPRCSANKWIGPSDDVLSGSEDEEEFGSVARFLCQKETLLSKKVETEQRVDIPSSENKDNYVANFTIEKSQDSPVNESLVGFMRSLNTRSKHQYERGKEDIHAKSNPSDTSNGDLKRGHPYDRNNNSVSTNDPSRTSAWLPYSKDLQDISKDNQSYIMVKGPSLPECLLNGSIPGINNTVEDPKMCHLQSRTTLQASLGKYDQLTAQNEINDSSNTNSTLHSLYSPVSTNSLLHANVMQYDTRDCILQFTSKVPGDSSAVQQNIPALLVENLDLSKAKSNMQEPDTKVPVSFHELRFYQYRLPSQVPATISGHTVSSRSLPTRHQSPPYRSTPLTLPEMYDFFFDDVSESGIVETGTNMASQEAIPEATIYTPDMYEYFFVEEDENTITSEKDIKDNKPDEHDETSVNVHQASSPLVTASWPEACEFFFADGPQHQDREGILYSKPSSQVQRPTNVFQSIVPKGLKGFTFRRASRARDAKLFPHVDHGTSEESNVPTKGSIVPYLSPSRSDACLMFLALASWAVKSSDLQSSDGWKTALLANIGAVSAIRYLRRRRRTWQGPSLEPLEET